MQNQDGKNVVEVKEGIVGYFDILGFKNYIKNDPDLKSKTALEIILNIKASAKAKIKEKINDPIFDKVTWTVLSDTIVLSIPYLDEPNENPGDLKQQKKLQWVALLIASVILMDHMFDKGLPVRGAISFGKYFVTEQSLAGKSIVDALSLAEKLNLSATTICFDAEKELEKLFEIDLAALISGETPYLLRYLIPLRAGQTEKLLAVNQWVFNDTYLNCDITQFVAQAFWKHNKDIDGDAFQKLQNTEMLLRYIVAVRRNWRPVH